MTRICGECGHPIEDGMDFCLYCGANVPDALEQTQPGVDAQPNGWSVYVGQPTIGLSSALKKVSSLIGVWVIASTVMLIIYLVNASSLVSALSSQGTMLPGYMLEYMMTCCLLSSIFAGISSFLCYKCQYHAIATVSCAAASVLSIPAMGGFLGLLTFLAGFNVTLTVYRLKCGFKS